MSPGENTSFLILLMAHGGQAFDRQTPDGNEGFVIEIQYLERAFSTNTYLIDKVTGSLFMLHDNHIESTGLCGSECVFDLQGTRVSHM